MQCCQYIMGDRARFDDQGLTETGLSSSISNLFVSAVILTDKQSACNITSTLTECDSASTRHEKMALAEWIGNKQKAIQKALLEESLFAENIFPKNLYVMCVQARRCFHIYISFAPYITPYIPQTILVFHKSTAVSVIRTGRRRQQRSLWTVSARLYEPSVTPTPVSPTYYLFPLAN